VATIKEVTVPDIGDFDEVEIIEVLVGPGDTIAKDQSLITLESDKATMEVPSPYAGVVKELAVEVGDKASQGSLILSLEAAEGQTGPEAEQRQSAAAKVDAEEKAQPKAEGETKAAEKAQPRQRETAEAKAGGEASPPGDRSEEVRVPDIGDFADVEVIEVLVGAGDRVDKEQSLITLESDKATLEIPAPFAGIVSTLEVKVGDRVSEGSPIAVMEVAAAPDAAPEAAPAPPSQPPTEKPAEARPGEVPPQPHPVPDALPVVTAPAGKAHASPSVRRFARELGVDVSQVDGSGPKGRVLKEDVQRYVKRVMRQLPRLAPAAPGLKVAEAPKIDFAKFGEIEQHKLSRIKRKGAPHLHRAWVTIPHVTQFDEAEISALEEWRRSMAEEAEKRGTKLTPLVFIMKAAVAALKEFPQFNSSLAEDAEHLILKRYYHIGVAVDTPDGLVVPVIRDVDRKDVFELARETREVAARARDRKLRPEDIQGGSFSISSLGGLGGTNFTPVINAPEVAILGVARSKMQPVWDEQNGQFRPALMLPVALSYDHRVIDGAEAVRFTRFLCTLLEDPERLMQG
jgi:pyruvate dehydrogenase E2 component (dihydrolipoamide acetyltransferase)